MRLILGVYGPENLTLGPKSSILIQPNPFFVQKVKVQEIDELKPGPKLYGFYNSAPLETVSMWSEKIIVSVPADSHQDIFTSSSYYVGLGNLNLEEVEVMLITSVLWLMDLCSFSVLFPNGNAIVITSPKTEQDTGSDNWQVRVSYEPIWLSYVVGIGGVTVIMFVAFNFFNKFQCVRKDGIGFQYGDMESARAPLLEHKDDDSSYDSISNDEGNLEEFLTASSSEGKSLRDGEDGNNTWRLCAICFDAPWDCFFLPCGHCVACFECGTRYMLSDLISASYLFFVIHGHASTLVAGWHVTLSTLE